MCSLFSAECDTSSRLKCETRRLRTTRNDLDDSDDSRRRGRAQLTDTKGTMGAWWKSRLTLRRIAGDNTRTCSRAARQRHGYRPAVPVRSPVAHTSPNPSRWSLKEEPRHAHSRAALWAEPPLHLVLVRTARGEPLGLALDVHAGRRAHEPRHGAVAVSGEHEVIPGLQWSQHVCSGCVVV